MFTKQCAKREPAPGARSHQVPTLPAARLKRVLLRESQGLLREEELFLKQRKGLDVVFYNKTGMKAFVFVICKLLGSTFLCREEEWIFGIRRSCAKLLFPVRINWVARCSSRPVCG